METTRFARRQRTGDARGGTRAEDGGVKTTSCALLWLPSALVGSFWPAERFVMGLRVCKHLRRELVLYGSNALLVKNNADAGDVKDDFRRISHLAVSLRWTGETESLNLASSQLGKGLKSLHVRRLLPDAHSGLESLAQVVSSVSCDTFAMLCPVLTWEVLKQVAMNCTAMTSLDLNNNQIGGHGAEKLAGVVGRCKTLSSLTLRQNHLGARGGQR
eukprot:574608-Rhodomonas_salina.3